MSTATFMPAPPSSRIMVRCRLFGSVVRLRSIAGAPRPAADYRVIYGPGQNPASALVSCLRIAHRELGRTMGGPDAHQRGRCDGCLRHAGAIIERYDNSNMYSSVSQVVPVATVFTTSIRLIVCSHLFGMVVRPRSIAGARQRATGYRGVCVPGRNPASMLVLC